MFHQLETNKILALVKEASVPGRMPLVAIDGLTCAGKSTLARSGDRALEDASVVGVDDFYRPLAAEERAILGPEESYDRYFDWEQLLRDVLGDAVAGNP